MLTRHALRLAVLVLACSAAAALPEMDAAKKAFLTQAGDEYGYDGRIDELYAQEIAPRLPATEHYLDWTGSALYWGSQIEAIQKELDAAVYGNPHSDSPSSERATKLVEGMRSKLLEFFGASPDEYEVVYTRSATGALQQIAEVFPFTNNSHFAYTMPNHKSVVGIRAKAEERGATWDSVSQEAVEAWLAGEGPDLHPANLTTTCAADESGCPKGGEDGEPVYSLFAYPGYDNHNGAMYPHRWVREVQAKSAPRHRWYVLFDTAAYAPSHPINLTELGPDFACISFYKLFGYPTGVGALIMRKEASKAMRTVYYGGASGDQVAADLDWHQLSDGALAFEHGTLPFQEIMALQQGLDVYEELGGVAEIERHVDSLGRWLHETARTLKHSNGAPLLKINSARGVAKQGATLNFNILDPSGNYQSFRDASAAMADDGLHVRHGCMCNPGGCQVESLDLRDEEWVETAERTSAWNDAHPEDEDVQWEWTVVTRPPPGPGVETKLERRPVGTIRASLGSMSRFEDAYALLDWLERKYTDVDADTGYSPVVELGWVPPRNRSVAADELKQALDTLYE